MALKGPASEKQVSFLTSLINKKEVEAKWVTVAVNKIAGGLTKDEASKMIDWFNSQPAKVQPTVTFAQARPDVQAGVYTLADGTICKVQKSRTGGGLYAKRMLMRDGKPSFVYESGLIHSVRNTGTVMSLDDACKLGIQTGVCIICDTPLSDPVSIARGIGPVCMKKQGALAGVTP